MDEAVDQVMGRSSDEKGAEKAVAIRKSQQKERARLQAEITTEQKNISQISEERAPIAAEVRKVEAEVGPIKYIAKFLYGEHGADENMLEQAVTWIIILIVVVFDPLAVIMLLAAQMTFGWKKEEPVVEEAPAKLEPTYPKDDGPITEAQVEQIKEHVQTHTEVPSETQSTALGGDITAPEEKPEETVEDLPLEQWNKMIAEAEAEAQKEVTEQEARKYQIIPELEEMNKERLKPDLTEVIEPEESKKKTYMTKAPDGSIQIKSRS
jgi:septal ring factor EnvC (AmiA/AmiB activator)